MLRFLSGLILYGSEITARKIPIIVHGRLRMKENPAMSLLLVDFLFHYFQLFGFLHPAVANE
jgi:hypothetical protein